MFTPIFVTEMLLLGAAVGVISASLGLGGGIIMVPAFLEFIPGMDPHTAKGTSLFIIVFVALVNVWRLNRGHAETNWRISSMMAIGSFAGGWIAAWGTSFLPGKAILWFFVTMMAVAAWRTFTLKPSDTHPCEVRRRFILGLCIGFVTGIVSGATGLGGGIVLVPLALMMGVVANERISAVSNAVMVVTCVAATIAHLSAPNTTGLPHTFGQVNIAVAPLVFVGAQAGGPFGKWLNERLSLRHRKVVMGVLLLVIGARLMYRALT